MQSVAYSVTLFSLLCLGILFGRDQQHPPNRCPVRRINHRGKSASEGHNPCDDMPKNPGTFSNPCDDMPENSGTFSNPCDDMPENPGTFSNPCDDVPENLGTFSNPCDDMSENPGMGSLGQIFDPTLQLHLFPYLMQCCIRHSANTGHLSGASPQFPHHVAYNILLSFFRMKHELCYIACSTMLQNLHSHGLIVVVGEMGK